MESLSHIPSKKSIRNSDTRDRRTRSVEQTIKFARRTSSGRYIDLPREELDMPDESPGDPMHYTVHIPLTPDNQPMPTTSATPSSFVFTGGLDGSKMMSQGSCSMQGCDGESMRDERGNNVYPCPCRFEICVDCFSEAEKNSGSCPGCKQAYSSNKSFTMSNESGELENKSWLFETQGAYSDYCTKDGFCGHDTDGIKAETMDKPWMPLSRKLTIRASVISPYRLLIFTRAVALGFFLAWRIQHPNDEAVWLWIMSVLCEIWFAFAWILDQVPKISPINRSTDLIALQDRFDMPSPSNPTGRSDLPGVDIFVSTIDPVKESPLVTANTILSILAVDYPVEKLACYVSDDGASLLTFEAMAEAAGFADTWVPFCRKHDIESRNPESYFNMKGDPTKNKSRPDFVKDRRKIKREYDEFKVRINGLQESIRRRSDAYNAREEMKMVKQRRETGSDPTEPIKVHKATWLADGTHWAGTWVVPSADHAKEDHAGILQMMMNAPSCDPVMGCAEDTVIDFADVDIRLPMFVYVSREKRLGYEHNKKAGAMNALARASAILSNGPFILNLDCDSYIYNCKAVSEGMCFMLDRGAENICYVQFPQRFDGIDPSDRYANNNNVFFDGYMRALDGLQGPVYVGTGCLFRRYALYGFDPPEPNKLNRNLNDPDMHAVRTSEFESDIDVNLLPKRFGNSSFLADSVVIAEYQGRPLADHPMVKYGRRPGVLTTPRDPLDAAAVADAVSVISIWYEDKTAWGENIGWIYGSVTEELVTGYLMHNRGWRSVYCFTRRDAFRGSASINLTDRLHQVLQRATSCVQLFFSRNSALIASKRLKFLQRIAYLNIGIYPFTSLFLVVYCFLPALCLFSGHFIIQSVNITLLVYLLLITFCLIGLAVLEVKWSGIGLEEWWRNEQFWVISGTSAHLAAVIQGLLKTIVGVDVSFALTSKTVPADDDDKFADLYAVKWSLLMILPITIGLVNIIALVVGFSRTIYSKTPEWSEFMIRAAFSSWVLVHLYPFAKGLMGRRGKTPTIVFVWSGLVAITLSLLWISVNPQIGQAATGAGDASARGALQIP